MKYVCVRCGALWGDSNGELSGGLCTECMTELIRAGQRRRGLHVYKLVDLNPKIWVHLKSRKN